MAPFDSLRLLADDLTGALDSAVGFVRAFGPLDVGIEMQEGRSLCSIAARGKCRKTRQSPTSPHWRPCWRPRRGGSRSSKSIAAAGSCGAELASILARNSYTRVIIAPALPAQGRSTENGRQILKGVETGEDLAATLSNAGHAVTLRPPGPPADCITLFDAETDADLDRIVEQAMRLPGATLWVGTSGLAAAMGRAMRARSWLPVPPPTLPLLGLIGTNHPVAQAQADAVRSVRIPAKSPGYETLRQIQFALVDSGTVFVTCDLPANTPRDVAHRLIAQSFGECLAQLPRPGTLFASGGETLRALLEPLGARALRVEHEFLPGVPLSTLVGGRWSGLPILSKSGAFGDTNLLSTLIGALKPAGKASFA